MCNASVDVDKFDADGFIVFKIDVVDCEDSAGSFDFEYDYRMIDGVIRKAQVSETWLRTHNTKTVIVERNIVFYPDEEALTAVRVIQSSIRCQCYISDSAIAHRSPLIEKLEALINVPFDPTAIDVICTYRRAPWINDMAAANQILHLEDALKARIREAVISFGQPADSFDIEWVNYNVIGGIAEYGDVIRGLRQSTEVEKIVFRNDSGLQRETGRSIKTTTRVGLSVEMSTNVISKTDFNIEIDGSLLDFRASESITFNQTRTARQDFSKQTDISEDRTFSVSPHHELTVTMGLVKRMDAVDFVADIVCEGEYRAWVRGAHVVFPVTESISVPLNTVGKRTFKVHGRLFNVSVQDVKIDLKEVPVTQPGVAAPPALYSTRFGKHDGSTLGSRYFNEPAAESAPLVGAKPRVLRHMRQKDNERTD